MSVPVLLPDPVGTGTRHVPVRRTRTRTRTRLPISVPSVNGISDQ